MSFYKNLKRWIVVFITLSALTISCGKPPINGDLNRVAEELRVTVNYYENEKELNKALSKELKDWTYKEGLMGQAIWSPQDNICNIYLIKPKYIDDSNTKTLGHELMHCIHGTYHK